MRYATRCILHIQGPFGESGIGYTILEDDATTMVKVLQTVANAGSNQHRFGTEFEAVHEPSVSEAVSSAPFDYDIWDDL